MTILPTRWLCTHSTQTTNPTNRHDLIKFRIREDSWNFANFLSKSWRSTILLRYRHDRVTNIRGIRLESLKYCQEFTTIYKNRLRILHERIWISYESVKNMPNACTNQVRLKLNSWLFLTIRGIFPQDSSYLFRTCFGVYSWDSWQIRSRFMIKPRIHESPNQVRIPTNAYESNTMQLRCLRMHYEFVTN